MTPDISDDTNSLSHTKAMELHTQYGRLLEALALHQPLRAQEAARRHRAEPDAAATLCWSLREEFDSGTLSDDDFDSILIEVELLESAWQALFELSEPHWRSAAAALDPANRDDALAVLQAQIWRFDPLSDVPLSAHVAWRMVPALKAAMAAV